MKKLICIASLFMTTATLAGPLADVAKAKFESDMLQALENTGGGQKKINEFMAKLPGIEKQLRGLVRDELKNKKSCLKIKRDFVKQQREIMAEEDWPDQDFVDSMLSATGDYVATVCLDMK